jgi:hypothetical protein
VSEPGSLHRVNRQHLDVLSDRIGILQHAIGSSPDPAHGYCVDDVARALQVDLLHARVLGWAAVAPSAWRAFRFLGDAFVAAGGRFRNFRSIDGSWIGGPGSPDSHGRAVLALGDAIATAPDRRLVDEATALLLRALPATRDFTSPRAVASVVLGCAATVGATRHATASAALELLANRLHQRFVLHADMAWPWPEASVTYENALLPRALIVAGEVLGSRPMIDTGLRALDWLIDAQTSTAGHLSPIGNGWWRRDGERSRFDQQPIEATALLLAAESALAVTGDRRYLATMERCYAWFLGANDLGLDVADPGRGAGRDGLTATGVNANEGAESTLMWLIALEHVRAMRETRPRASSQPVLLATAAL